MERRRWAVPDSCDSGGQRADGLFRPDRVRQAEGQLYCWCWWLNKIGHMACEFIDQFNLI